MNDEGSGVVARLMLFNLWRTQGTSKDYTGSPSPPNRLVYPWRVGDRHTTDRHFGDKLFGNRSESILQW